MTERAEVVVVGGGPAGAATAALLARAGRSVVLLERSPGYRWRACGVFASPTAWAALRALGLDEASLARLSRPVPAMQVETRGGACFGLDYGAAADARRTAVGFDRSALDPALLELARSAGADVRIGVAAELVEPAVAGRRSLVTVRAADRVHSIEADLLVGADGIRSIVARSAGVARTARLGRRIGLTWHVAEDPSWAGAPRDARMVVLDGAYCGIAPVPGGRLNVGLVLAGRAWLRRLRDDGAAATARAALAAVPAHGPARAELDAPALDAMEGAAPLGHRVARRAGTGWLLVGDAAGFLDPFTGEGLHRALVSATLAAEVADAALRRGAPDARDMAAYDRAMAGRFAAKDLVSLLVQAFLRRPALFEYASRRLASRATVRQRLGLVMADLVSARAGLDPRFLARLLAP